MDCGAQGKCVDTEGTALPRRQCYCNLGWFGPGCNKSACDARTYAYYLNVLDFIILNTFQNIFHTESVLKSTDIDFTLYRSRQLSPDYRIHWRILKEQKEIEMVMVVNGTSWAALGWRPRQLNATCRNFPAIHELGYVEPQAEPQAEPSAEPEPEPEAEPTSEPTFEPSSSEPAGEPEPKSSKTKRDDARADITVATSVSYRVSAKTGRRRRAAATTESEFFLLCSDVDRVHIYCVII